MTKVERAIRDSGLAASTSATGVPFVGRDHGPGCGHPERFATRTGSVACEQCARDRDGWGNCWRCATYGPLHYYEIDDGAGLCDECAVDEEGW